MVHDHHERGLGSVDEMSAPQRMVAGERNAGEVAREVFEGSGAGHQRRVDAMHVVADVERGIFDPPRHTETRLDHALAEARIPREPRSEPGLERFVPD